MLLIDLSLLSISGLMIRHQVHCNHVLIPLPFVTVFSNGGRTSYRK